jgi:hypothetical protein
MRKASVDGCGTCHVNQQGGGPRNDFGRDFAEAKFTITPMLRASYPDRFEVRTAPVTAGATIHFADPSGQSVVYEKDQKKFLVEFASLAESRPAEGAAPARAGADPAAGAAAPAKPDAEPRHPIRNFSFFITSAAPGNGGNLGGLAGADRHCQTLAAAVAAGNKTWRAYLSTSYEGKPAVNAGDRIGSGPWFNANGQMIAHGVADLHGANNRLKERALTEKGTAAAVQGILSGSLPDGTAAVDKNCNNWTSAECSLPELKAPGEGAFMCFAVNQ